MKDPRRRSHHDENNCDRHIFPRSVVVFLILLIGQKLRGWRGRQVIVMTVLGVTLLSLAYFGSKLVREFLH